MKKNKNQFQCGDAVEVRANDHNAWLPAVFVQELTPSVQKRLYYSDPYLVCLEGPVLPSVITFRQIRRRLPDWPVDHPVWVRDQDTGPWHPAHFYGWSQEGRARVFKLGSTSHTRRGANCYTEWSYATDIEPMTTGGS